MPGTWKVFFSDVIVGVARSEGVLTLPMPVYVDDCVKGRGWPLWLAPPTLGT